MINNKIRKLPDSNYQFMLKLIYTVIFGRIRFRIMDGIHRVGKEDFHYDK